MWIQIMKNIDAHVNKSWKILKRSKYPCQGKITGGCFVFPFETEVPLLLLFLPLEEEN